MDYTIYLDDSELAIKIDEPDEPIKDAYRTKLFFKNGYGASVIWWGDSELEGLYGKSWELAVLIWDKNNWKDFRLCYDSPITSDVNRHFDRDELMADIRCIAAL